MSMWQCPRCGFRNRPSNFTCGGNGKLGCGAPRDAGITNGEGEGFGSFPANSLSASAGEWHCVCGFRNRASNSICGGGGQLGCRRPRLQQFAAPDQEAPAADVHGIHGVSSAPQPGEWVCSSCGFRNRASNSCCGGGGKLGCQAPRVVTEGSTSVVESPTHSGYKAQEASGSNETEARLMSQLIAVSIGEEKGNGSEDVKVRAEEQPAAAEEGTSQDASPVSASPWTCALCSFKNQASNEICGGFGRLGCKAPRATAEAIKRTWVCAACEAENEATVSSCASCDTVRRYSGMLKSLGADYGFISCSDTMALHGTDVYVGKKVLDSAFRKGTISSGAAVEFLLALNDAGQPNAKVIWPLDEMHNALEDNEYYGVLKYVSEEKGFGFIECSDIQDTFGSDAYVSIEQLKYVSLGQCVKFQIRLGQVGGRPQARQLSAAGPPPEVLPGDCTGTAEIILQDRWKQRMLLLGEGDFSFACAAASLHPGGQMDATVFLDESQWKSRFPNDEDRIKELQDAGHHVRFNVDATKESCASYRVVFFNFPNVSAREWGETSSQRTPSGDLAFAFLQNVRESADHGTLVVLGLWGRCDGGADTRLYGQDAHELVAEALATPCTSGNNLVDALLEGYPRNGVYADYGFYTAYEGSGYCFRTNCNAAFETSNREWHLKACFVLRVVGGF
eukprot:TRINITY_DN108307_c0_g1_i1.p1 TRINITY_DN108307_c0_g1~~TRINITY_DN108307_c0_g1_i1.p1  ORF type:complete len:676 (+),score=126.59 TRINITY_DN108307_c0_g1_i1:23-2050(+)